MKMRMYLLLIFVSGALSSNGQWEWVNPGTTLNDFVDISMTVPGKAWLMSYDGTIMYTPDNGETWLNRSPADPVTGLTCIWFLNDQQGWVAGNNGIIFYTSDGGLNWIQQESGTSADIEDIAFSDELNGCMVGKSGTLLHTNDGGNIWRPVAVPGPWQDFTSVFFLDSANCWAIGNNPQSIIGSSDGGGTWTHLYTFPNTVVLDKVCFADPMNGVITAQNDKLFKTTDGGTTWIVKYLSPYSNSVDVCLFADGTGFLLVSYDYESRFAKTEDFFGSWDNLFTFYNNSTDCMGFTDTLNGMITGANGFICSSQDGGHNWTDIRHSITSEKLNSVFFLDEEYGWIAGTGDSIFHTEDGGATWEMQEFPNPNSTYPELSCICFFDYMNGYACGNSGYFLTTNDGGENWVAQNTGSSGWFYDASFIDQQHGWIAGSGGNLYRTMDGGVTWEGQYTGFNDLMSVCFVDSHHGWLATGQGQYDGAILYTIDGGINWIPQLNTFGSINAITFLDSQHGWAVSEMGEALFTRNGGIYWQYGNVPIYLWFTGFRDICMKNQNEGWICGDQGSILHTVDGGVNWTEQVSNSSTNIYSVWFTDTGHGWAVGDSGMILRTQNGGFPVHDESIPPPVSNRSCILYPNPANDNVTLEFTLEKTSAMELSVVSTDGRTVLDRSFGILQKGDQKIQIDLSALNPGIYVLRGIAGKEVMIKKMVKN